MKNQAADTPLPVREKSALATRRRTAAPCPGTVPDGETPPQEPAAQPAPVATASAAFPIVGIGASAGGLEAFEAFFRACPIDTGMAFVLVPHLYPGHASLLSEILQRCTAMPVVEALDRIAVAPDHVYVIPPNREMAILGGALQLSVPELVRGQRMPIDGFLRSLAEDQAEHAIGIILSGTATDGTLGLRAILGSGGVCMVQEPANAKYEGMPSSAIKAGYATHILAVADMPAMLVNVARQVTHRLHVAPIAPERVQSGINQILLQLRSATGHDFSLYKKSTITRRIQRRMAQHTIEDEAVYARFLKENPAETQLLFRELLINVTSFFRDREAFVMLKDSILPALLKGKPDGYDFRIWVAGCASGEEAYSIAMVLTELQDEITACHDQTMTFQIYATDLDDEAIATARAGRYPPNIAQDVTAERLRRFFTREPDEHGGYKVKKEIRDLIVFAVQNVIKDPPFTKLDLLSCRNLMIYLESELQSRLAPLFHYALRPDGVLFLSTSESITNRPDLFKAINHKWKFYSARRSPGAPDPKVDGGMVWTTNPGTTAKRSKSGTAAGLTNEPASGKAGDKAGSSGAGNVAVLSTHALLQNYAPASVTTDSRGNILFVHGDTGRYLRPAPGPISNNVVEMAREGLQRDLRFAISQAASAAAPTLSKLVSVKTNGGFSMVRFSVRALPQDSGGEPLLLVSFEDLARDGQAADKPAHKPAGRGKHAATQAIQAIQATQTAEAARIEELERELAYSRENLQTTSEAQQASNEELQSANEELQSSNEELETSKEELQSLNEEAVTANSELHARIRQLTGLENDMKNLLDCIATGTLFLDEHLLIRRYTPAAVKVYRLIAGDAGRPLGDITSNFDGADTSTRLQADLRAVLDTLIPIEREVRCSDGAWYLARMQPYRTLDNVIQGVALTFIPVTDFKLASEAAQRATEQLAIMLQANTQQARELAEGIVNTVVEPLLVLDGDLQVISASRSFYEHFQVAAGQTVGRKIYELGNGQWDIPALRELLENILPQNQVMDGYVVEHNFPGLGFRRMVLNARRIVTAQGNTELILLAIAQIAGPE